MFWEPSSGEGERAGHRPHGEYAWLGGGGSLNAAPISHSVQIVCAGVAPLLTLWDRTRSNFRRSARGGCAHQERPGWRNRQVLLVTSDKTNRALAEEIRRGLHYNFDMTPPQTMKMAQFMYRIGLLKTLPQSCKDYFFELVHGEQGS
jgi:hypothetical protein